MTSESGSGEGRRGSMAFAGGLALLFVLVAAPLLDQYAVTWDEALGDFFFGQRYLSYFTSLDGRYLDFEADPYPEGHVPDLRASPFRVRPWEYYPFANLSAAATSKVTTRLGLTDPLDGFHAVNLLFGGALVAALFLFVEGRLGRTAALLAVGSLFTMPRIVCHAMANVKDFPEMVLFSLTLLAFLHAWERVHVPWMLGAGVLCGLALATKANALFLAPIFLLVVVLGGIPTGWTPRLLLLTGGGCAALGLGLPLLLWPWLWPDPIGRVSQHLSYVSGQVFQVREESLLSPLQALLFTTPPLTLLAVLVGCVPLVGALRARDRLAALLAAWIAVTLGRMYLPGAVNFDGVRHFLELMPAVAIVAAWGGLWLLERAFGAEAQAPSPTLLGVEGRRATLAAALVLVGVVVPSLGATVRTHPHQIAYWNVLVGGTAGAFERGLPQAGDYWGMSYRQGLAWINENAPEGSVLAVPLIEHAVALQAPVRLRPDIGLAHISIPQTPQIPQGAIDMLQGLVAERPVYVMYVVRDDWSNALTELTRTLPAEREWSVDGAVILRIVRLAPAASR